MKIETGYLYHIKDSFFECAKDARLMINHKQNRKRPTYFAIKEGEIFWFIPLSTKVDKYKMIIQKKIERNGYCDSIVIGKILNSESAILIQNAFPIIEKYIDHVHKEGDVTVMLDRDLQKIILRKFKLLLSLKNKGINLFFTDIDKLKKLMLSELKKDKIFS